jgi:UDP-glucose 4-epimerase
MPGVTVRVTDDCSGCGTCADEACIFQAVTIEEDKAVINDNCRGCGRCASLCPEGAIEVVVEEPDFIQQTIERLSKIDYT